MVSLTPMNGEVKPNSWVLFTCSYESPEPLYIYFKLSPYHGWPLTASSATPGPITRTQKGYLRTWHVYVQLDPCNVECYIQDRGGEELIKVVTSVTPGLAGHITRNISCLSVPGSRIHSAGLILIRVPLTSTPKARWP